MSFFKNIEAGLNSGLDALAQEYGKVNQPQEGGGSGSAEEGGGSSNPDPATPQSGAEASGSGSVGQRMSALLNAIEPGSLSTLEQSASGALKAFTPKLPMAPSLKLPSTEGLFPGFPGDAATEDEAEVAAAAAAAETRGPPPEAAEAARCIAEAEGRATAAEARAAVAEARAATAERMAEDVETRAEAAVEEAETRAAMAEDEAARHGLARAPAGEAAEAAEAAEAVPGGVPPGEMQPGEMPAEIAAALNVSSPPRAPACNAPVLHPSCTRPAPVLRPLHTRHPRRPLPAAGGPCRGVLGGGARARGGGGTARRARGLGGGGGDSGDAT